MDEKSTAAAAPEATGAREHSCFCLGAGPEITRAIRSLGADSAFQHFRNARIEVLKGLRELIDRRIESITREEAKGTKVTVE